MALAVQAAYLEELGSRARTLLIVNTLETSRAELELGGVKVAVDPGAASFPARGNPR